MEIITTLEQKSKTIVRLAVLFQLTMVIIAISILYFKPSDYLEIGQKFSAVVLFLSFVAGRLYINNGKRLEEQKRLSKEEMSGVTYEYFLIFFAPYLFWMGCLWVFS